MNPPISQTPSDDGDEVAALLALPPLERLQRLMHRLRGPGGCPWDAEQTHLSLLPCLIEEAYEVAEAIRSGDREAIVDELGDLLLQPVFHAEIGSETGSFDLDDVAAAICEKLIRRHPHVFGDRVVGDSQGVLRQWDQIKQQERATAGKASAEYHIQSAQGPLPALMQAAKIQKKAAKVGFDWPHPEQVLPKVREEVDEVAEALESGDPARVAEELGDLLFATVNLVRKCGLDPENLLAAANTKFVRRFQSVEDTLRLAGKTLDAASLEEKDAAWNAAKTK